MKETITEMLDGLTKSYMRSEWLGSRRMLNEPAARQELLAGGSVVFTEPDSSNFVWVYVDPLFEIPAPNPIAFEFDGGLVPLYFKAGE